MVELVDPLGAVLGATRVMTVTIADDDGTGRGVVHRRASGPRRRPRGDGREAVIAAVGP
jgi:hypothetical protein